MANFGKKARLECQKSTVGVECLVSVYETIYEDDKKTPARYRVIVQRLQDGLTEEQANEGLADVLPYITNKKIWSHDELGNASVSYSHYDFILPEVMDSIAKAAKNCYVTKVKVEDEAGIIEDYEVKNYCVRLNIGFNLAKGEAFFYRIKTNIDEDNAKDVKYNQRHEPKEGRELTDDIIAKHEHITQLAKAAFERQKALEEKNSTGSK